MSTARELTEASDKKWKEHHRAQVLSMLDDLELGDIEDNWQTINATDRHGNIAKVVIHFEDDTETDPPYVPGVELARRIVAMPKMIAALQSIASADPGETHIYALMVLARDVLAEAGLPLKQR
jgi:hypothetical protein